METFILRTSAKSNTFTRASDFNPKKFLCGYAVKSLQQKLFTVTTTKFATFTSLFTLYSKNHNFLIAPLNTE